MRAFLVKFHTFLMENKFCNFSVHLEDDVFENYHNFNWKMLAYGFYWLITVLYHHTNIFKPDLISKPKPFFKNVNVVVPKTREFYHSHTSRWYNLILGCPFFSLIWYFYAIWRSIWSNSIFQLFNLKLFKFKKYIFTIVKSLLLE